MIEEHIFPLTKHKREKFVSSNYHVKGRKIIDIGCGKGRYLDFLSRGKFVVGLDNNPSAIKLAKSKKTNFILADVNELPFKSGSFDFVLFSEVMEHLENPNKALSEIYRIMKRGASLVLTTPSKKYPFTWDPENKIRELLNLKIRKRKEFSNWTLAHKKLYSSEELKEVLKKARLKEIKVYNLGHLFTPLIQWVWFLFYLLEKRIMYKIFRINFDPVFNLLIRISFLEDKFFKGETCITLIAEAVK